MASVNDRAENYQPTLMFNINFDLSVHLLLSVRLKKTKKNISNDEDESDFR